MYDVNVPGAKPLSVNVTCAAFAGSPLTTMIVRGGPVCESAAKTLNRFGSPLWVAEIEVVPNV